VIQGGAETFGSLTIQRPTSANEGDSAEVNLVFHLPDSQNGPGPALFEEKGLFIKDTVPLSVSRHLLLFDSSNAIPLDVTATDTGTTPLAAGFWYSTDGWSDSPLTSTTDLFDDQHHTRVFSGDISTFAPVHSASILCHGPRRGFQYELSRSRTGKSHLVLRYQRGYHRYQSHLCRARGKTVSPGDPRDVDRDCQIKVNDARACVLGCSKPNRAP
jgi:hypothetical protein